MANKLINSKYYIAPLSKEEIDCLESIVRKRNNPQYLVERANIILLANQGVDIIDTSRQLNIVKNTVRKWRKRWNDNQDRPVVERLGDKPRPGAPARITPKQICSIVALACEDPQKYKPSSTHWTQQELANQAMKQGIIDTISQRSVGRFLKSGRPEASPDPLLAHTKRR